MSTPSSCFEQLSITLNIALDETNQALENKVKSDLKREDPEISTKLEGNLLKSRGNITMALSLLHELKENQKSEVVISSGDAHLPRQNTSLGVVHIEKATKKKPSSLKNQFVIPFPFNKGQEPLPTNVLITLLLINPKLAIETEEKKGKGTPYEQKISTINKLVETLKLNQFFKEGEETIKGSLRKIRREKKLEKYQSLTSEIERVAMFRAFVNHPNVLQCRNNTVFPEKSILSRMKTLCFNTNTNKKYTQELVEQEAKIDMVKQLKGKYSGEQFTKNKA